MYGFCSSGEEPVSKSFFRPPNTMLDSLQGKWVSVEDTLNTMTIFGNFVDEYYKFENLHHEYFRIYFSDTLIDYDKIFSQITIDTTAVSGNYLIKVSTTDNSVWCYDVHGFYSNGGDITFSMSDTWAQRRPTVFRKVN